MLLQVHSEILWTGDKDCSAKPSDRAGFWVMPPCVGFDNIPGHAFAHTPDRFFFFLDIERIVRVQITTREQKVFPSLGSFGGSFAGIAYLQNKVYTFVMSGSKDYLMVMDKVGTLLQRHELRDRQGKPRPLFGRRISISGPVYPFRTVATPSHSLLILEPHMWQQLCEYTLSGVLKREWLGVTGCALGREGQIYVSGQPQPASGVAVAKPPRELKKGDWQLVGIDVHNRFYWRSFIERTIPIKPSSKMTWTWAFSRLACGSLDGRLFWEIALDGPDGVLARYDPYLHASGGAGGGWIEIEPEGSILAFCVSRSEKVRHGVGLYRVRVSA